MRPSGSRPDALAGPAHRVTDRGGLAHPARVVDARPATDDGDRFEPEQPGDQRCRWGRVADAHVAQDQQIAAAVDFLVDDGTPEFEGGVEVGLAQSVLAVDASRRLADPVIDHPNGRAGLPGEHVDRGAPGREVGHHLRRHLRRVSRDSALGDAMVGSDDHHADAAELMRRARSLDGADPGGQVFEPAERAGGLGELQLPLFRLPAGAGIR